MVGRLSMYLTLTANGESALRAFERCIDRFTTRPDRRDVQKIGFFSILVLLALLISGGTSQNSKLAKGGTFGNPLILACSENDSGR